MAGSGSDVLVRTRTCQLVEAKRGESLSGSLCERKAVEGMGSRQCHAMSRWRGDMGPW